MRATTIRIMLMLLSVTGIASEPKSAVPAGYKLTWSEEFDGKTLDSSRWNVETGLRRGNHNVAEAVSVANGLLTITTFSESNRHCTGFISTKGKYESLYGYIEARIRFHGAPGMWSAFWMQSPTMGHPVGDVAKAGTEIDIVEHRKRDRAGKDISNMYQMNLHWDGYKKGVHKSCGGKSRPAVGRKPLQGEWHNYGFLWTPERYRFYLDGVEQWATTNALSRRSEFILLTSEIEDGGWAGNVPADGYGSREASTTKMEVN